MLNFKGDLRNQQLLACKGKFGKLLNCDAVVKPLNPQESRQAFDTSVMVTSVTNGMVAGLLSKLPPVVQKFPLMHKMYFHM